MGLDAIILVFWMLSFKPALSLSSLTFNKKLFSSFSLSAIKVVSSAYLRLLMFLPAILIPACGPSRMAFCMMYSACKLNKQGDNIQPWHSLFPIWNQSVVPCLVLTVASWPALHLTFQNPMDLSPPGPLSMRILQTRILEWIAIPFSRGSSWPRDWTWVSCNAGRFFIIWATREATNVS